MPRYEYKARDSQGAMRLGHIDASGIDEAGKQIRSNGLFIVSLNEGSDRSVDIEAPMNPQAAARRVKRDEVITFCHQLAVMVDTGVPLSEALDCTQQQAQSPHFRAVLQDVNEHVQGGTQLSAAFSKYPRVFPTVMTSLVKASEATGKMGEMLERVSHYLGKEQITRKKVKGALIYPAVMLGLCVLITVFLLAFVLPRFSKIYEGRGAALPGPTQFLMATSQILTDHWPWWLTGAVTLIVAMAVFLRSALGRRAVDYLKLHTPVIGGLFEKLYVTRACATMGTLVSAGVAMLDMVSIVRSVTANVYYDELWDRVGDRLRDGTQLSEPLFQSKLIPRSVAQMIYSGEKSGRLGSVMNRVAAYTEEELDDAIKTATQFIEPAMIIIMGMLIGFIALALLLPVFNLSNVVAGG